MSPTPFPTQLSGALFLADRRNALLADEPRVGKTGAAIIACDYNLDDTILVITTASGRPVWKRAFAQWSPFGRSVQVIAKGGKPKLWAQVVIVGWGAIAEPELRMALLGRTWDRVILDEAHWAKDFEAKRTQAAYGTLRDDGADLLTSAGLVHAARGAWPLTGTPIPHDPSDLYPMLRALFPERLKADAAKGWPDVTKESAFVDRYCVWRMKKLPRGFRRIRVVIRGRNEAELGARLEGLMLRRTQQDVGIRPPVYETLPLQVTSRMSRDAEGDLDRTAVLDAAKKGDTRALEMHMGPLRRITGEIKAHAVVEAVKEEFECGLDKIVLAYWHRDVGAVLRDGLSQFGVVGIDGSTSADARGETEQAFLTDPTKRVFLAQIEAASEAIDLSSAAVLWFVETVFSPRMMKQMALRITNHTQARQAVVRVCVLEGSIDEALQEILIRLWSTIREILQ